MTMSVTSPVCLQLLPSWCTAANDAESDKRQRLSSLFLRSHTSWPAKSNRSSRGDANSSSCGPRGRGQTSKTIAQFPLDFVCQESVCGRRAASFSSIGSEVFPQRAADEARGLANQCLDFLRLDEVGHLCVKINGLPWRRDGDHERVTA